MDKMFNYNIFLIGFMGAGKSTVANGLKNQLEMDYVEMDQLIAEQRGMAITDIFAEYGETYFRNLESNVLIELQRRRHTIVSCGGGIVVRKENKDYMKKNGRVVFLTASPQTVYERVKNSKERPILNNNMNVEFISQLLETRRALYEEAADITVATDGRPVAEICDEIVSKLRAYDEKLEQKEK